MKGLFSWKSLVIAIILLLFLIVILIIEISDNNPAYNAEQDYEFELSFGCYGKNNINTFNDTITKDLVSAGVITTNYIMPDYTKKKVFKMLRDMDILSYPKSLNFPLNNEHVDYLYLKVNIGGEEQIVRWTIPWGFDFYGEDGSKISVRHYQFKMLVEYISKHVYESDAWKALPAHEGGYL